MLIIDKKKDISILRSMGANDRILKRIFLLEGWMISILGAIIGIIMGISICWLQSNYGLLKFSQSGSFIVDSYPVEMLFSDIVNVLLIVILIGYLAAFIPVRQISK